ncbi:hypothetical protein [Klebsiella michiganensis]|uniref:hypothetical protein n=1 Tax=Klebsiella michiganensis TaxID=1134687 RepID=UPI003D97BE32
MHLKKSINDNSGNEVIAAVHYLADISIMTSGISFLLQSYHPDIVEKEDKIPFKASYYHCQYKTDKDVYSQCIEYLLTLDEFTGGEVLS